MSEILEKLFNSKALTRLLKVFLLNQNLTFSASEVAVRTRLDRRLVKQNLKRLSQIKFLNSKAKKGRIYYSVNQGFIFYPELRRIILKATPISGTKVYSYFKKIGQVKLLVITGLFLSYKKSPIDLLIVGENIGRQSFKHSLLRLEAEIGHEINYSLLNVKEFEYRRDMFDKFISQIFEGPHKVLINKLERKMGG